MGGFFVAVEVAGRGARGSRLAPRAFPGTLGPTCDLTRDVIDFARDPVL